MTSETTHVNGEFPSMVNTRHKPRRARSRLAAGRVFGEYLHDQRAERLVGIRWDCVDPLYESSTQSGDRRTLSPA
jgi:hypothetical protein